jgi:hypothetical protein
MGPGLFKVNIIQIFEPLKGNSASVSGQSFRFVQVHLDIVSLSFLSTKSFFMRIAVFTVLARSLFLLPIPLHSQEAKVDMELNTTDSGKRK